MTPWDTEPDNTEDFIGFVYLITNTVNNMKYIGQKKFWSERTLPPLKGYKRKRHIRKESDWRSYYGSSMELKTDLKKHGKKNFTRVMLLCCKTKQMLNYHETRLQFNRNAVLRDDFYNQIVNIRCMIPKSWLEKANNDCFFP